MKLIVIISKVNVSYQENAFLGKYDISLSNIDKIYQITDRKKKLVGPQYKNSQRIESIKILCKVKLKSHNNNIVCNHFSF